MHLSRFITIAIWARTCISSDLPLELADGDHLVALGAARAEVVEAVRELCVSADQVVGFIEMRVTELSVPPRVSVISESGTFTCLSCE